MIIFDNNDDNKNEQADSHFIGGLFSRLPITRKIPNFFLCDVLICKCPTLFQCTLCFRSYLPGFPLNPENNRVVFLIDFGPPAIFTCVPSLSPSVPASVSLNLGSSVHRKGALSWCVFPELYGLLLETVPGVLRTPGCSNAVLSASRWLLSHRNANKFIIKRLLILSYIFCKRSN